MEQILATEGLRHIAEKICNFLDWKSRSMLIMTNKIAIHFSASTFQKWLNKCQENGLCVDPDWISTIKIAQEHKMEWSLTILFIQIHRKFHDQLSQFTKDYFHPLKMATRFRHGKLVRLILEVTKVVPPLCYYNEAYYINRLEDFLDGRKKPFPLNTLMAYEKVFAYFLQNDLEDKLIAVAKKYLEKGFKFGALLIQLILNERDPFLRSTPMHIHALNGNAKKFIEHVKFAAKILDRDSNLPDAWGTTPMHIAAKLGHVEFVKALVPFWHNSLKEDRDGKTAYQIAKEKGHEEIMELMIKHTLG